MACRFLGSPVTATVAAAASANTFCQLLSKENFLPASTPHRRKVYFVKARKYPEESREKVRVNKKLQISLKLLILK